MIYSCERIVRRRLPFEQDLQFQFLGLIATYVYSNSPRNGLVFCLSLIALGWSYFYQQVTIHQPSPVLMEHPVQMERIFGFLKYHFLIYPNVNYYFAGFILATIRQPLPRTKAVKYGLLATFVTTFSCGQYFIALHNIFHLISKQFEPLYMLTHKLVWTVSFFTAGLYFVTFWTDDKRTHGASNEMVAESKEAHTSSNNASTARYSFMSGLTRIVFSIYLVNYFVIRTHFFTSRQLMRRAVYIMFTTCAHIRVYTIIVAFAFQLVFIMPFENLRRKYG